MYSTRIHETIISQLVPVVCESILKVLSEEYLKMPTLEGWIKIASEFNDIWQFPHCLGALDGRHITFRAPVSDGSYYYNYKETSSIVLLALANANYKFTYVNIGSNDRISYSCVFDHSKFGIALKQPEDNIVNLPEADTLPGQDVATPYFIVSDDVFPALPNLVKPSSGNHLNHEKKINNYRLSRARRVVESSFGMLVNSFRVLLNPISLSANKVELITLTCVLLHNYLSSTNRSNTINKED